MHNVADPPLDDPTATAMTELRQRAETLERQLVDLQKQTETRIVQAELKAEALRAGMVDLDGLRLIDVPSLHMNERGEIEGGASLMLELKKSKPWLFAAQPSSSSSVSSAPQVQSPKPKTALEMTEAEYRQAKAALIRKQS